MSTTDGRSGGRGPRRTALVLAGGGARGAYEAGVVRYLRHQVARDLGYQPRIDILCGTSVGAINACYLAATLDEPARQGEELTRLWTSLKLEDVFRLPAGHVLQLPKWLMGRVDGRMSLLRSAPLEKLVAEATPWGNIRRNVERGVLSALTVAATRVADGMVTLFVEAGSDPMTGYRDPNTQVQRVHMAASHALASAAIPIVFPAVNVDGWLFADGGLRQNTPLMPALALGADRILVVALRHLTEHRHLEERRLAGAGHYPSAPFLFGKVLDALLLDQVEHDLHRLRRMNALVDEARDRFGDDFAQRLGSLHDPVFGTRFRRVEEVALSAGRDIGEVAARHVEDAARAAGGLAGRLLRRLGSERRAGDEDLSSYLLFHGPYCRELIELAMEDCRQIHDRLCQFFSEPGAGEEG